MPRLPTVPGELAAAIKRARAEGRIGPEHRLDVARARQLAAMLADPGTPRSAVAMLDRRLDIILARLGFVSEASGPTELDEWLAGLDAEPDLDDDDDEGASDPSARIQPAEGDGPD